MNPSTHPIHPTSSTSTPAQVAMDGSTRTEVDAIRQLIFDEAPTWEENFPAGPGFVVSLTDAATVISRHNATKTATDVRPVVGVVARTLDDPASVFNPLVDGEELNEPLTVAEVREIEQFTWEFSDAAGNTTLAGDDLIRLCRQALRDSRELALTNGDLAVAVREALDARAMVAGQTKTIGVLGTAVGKVAQLHVDDGEGYCRACQTSPYPCETAAAIGVGQ